MKVRTILAAVALLASGCVVETTRIEADPVIGGRTYQNKPMDLGRIRTVVAMQAHVMENDKLVTDPEQIDLILGVASAGDPVGVVISSGTLMSKKDGKSAELTARYQVQGNAQGCATEPLGDLSLDYWYNARASADSFKCTMLRFKLPGHSPTNPLELTVEPINVGGELVRMLPVTFTYRVQSLDKEPPLDLQTCRMNFGTHPDTPDRRRADRERICKALERQARDAQ